MDEEIKNIPLFIERNPKLVAKFKKENTFDANCFRTTPLGEKEIFIPKKLEFFSKTKKTTKSKSLIKSNKKDEILHEIDELEPYSIENKIFDNEDYD